MTTTNTDNATATAPTPRYAAADIAAAVARALANADDRPVPRLDARRFPHKYAALAQDFQTSAWQHLDAGDLPQASNKAWGLAAETVKAVAAQHGGIIHKHHSIAEVIDQLCRLTLDAGDGESALLLGGSYMIAERLHINFYENEFSETIVLQGLIKCEELSARLYILFWPAGAPDPDPVTA